VRSDGDGLSAHQIIVAQTLTNSSSDQAQLAPLLDGIRANLRMNPDQASADAGYCSAANLGTLIRWRIAGYVATGRQKHGASAATASGGTYSMARRKTFRQRGRA
jgi:hypothetical protein